jgi:hypothetical protein
MLGDQITDMKGKVTGQRVLDAQGPTVETSVSATGSAKGIKINEMLTYVGKPSSPGVLHGKGQGVFTTESGMAAWTGEGIGRMTPSGIKWRGAVYLTSGSTGKLEFLNNMVGIFEAEIDPEGNFSEKSWEWK